MDLTANRNASYYKRHTLPRVCLANIRLLKNWLWCTCSHQAQSSFEQIYHRKVTAFTRQRSGQGFLNWSQARRQDLAAGGVKNQKEGPKTRRGAKNQKGGTFLKYSIGCMQQQVGQTWNGGAPISNGGAGHHWPPAGDGPAWSSWTPKGSDIRLKGFKNEI